MFYITIVPVLVLSAFMIARLRRLEKHDRVLYRFCEVRRGFMYLLRKSGHELSRSDYAAARALLDMLETNIHEYHETQRRLLNGRELVAALRKYSLTARAFDKLPEIQDQRVAKLRVDFAKAVLFGFFEYTPLLKSEVLARFFIASASLFARFGWRRMKGVASTLMSAKDTAERQGQEFGYAN